MILGTISAVDSSNGLQLIIDGEDTATTKKYTYMASYVPAANDRVLVEEVGGSYVVMGKVINDVASSGIARQADNATNADNATTAASCTGNAATATVASSCSGNAATATTAASCTGNAATATTANSTNGISYTCPATSGKLVTNYTREYISSLGKYVITDISTTYDQYFAHR